MYRIVIVVGPNDRVEYCNHIKRIRSAILQAIGLLEDYSDIATIQPNDGILVEHETTGHVVFSASHHAWAK